jgi:hypothetical protein
LTSAQADPAEKEISAAADPAEVEADKVGDEVSEPLHGGANEERGEANQEKGEANKEKDAHPRGLDGRKDEKAPEDEKADNKADSDKAPEHEKADKKAVNEVVRVSA